MLTNKYIDVVFFHNDEEKILRVYTNSEIDAANIVCSKFEDAAVMDCIGGHSNSFYNKGFCCLVKDGVQMFEDGGSIEYSSLSSLLDSINLSKLPSSAASIINDLKSNPDLDLITMDDPKVKILVEVLNKNYSNAFEEDKPEVQTIEVSEDAKRIALEIKDLKDLLEINDDIEDGQRIQNEINDLLAILEMEGVSYYTALTGKPIQEKEITYKLGDMYSNNFDDYGLFATALKADLTWGVDNLRLLYNSFEDNNYHTAGGELWETIGSLEKGEIDNAKESLERFKNAVKQQMRDSGYY